MAWDVLIDALSTSAWQHDSQSYTAIMQAMDTVNGAALVHAAQGFAALPESAMASSGLSPGVRDLGTITEAQWGAWVGPPRVTRANAAFGDYTIHAARVWEFPGDMAASLHAHDAVELLQHMVGAALNAPTGLSGDRHDAGFGAHVPSAVEFNPTLNGPLEWWRSGQAAQTRTRSGPDSTIGTRATENPVGPDTGALPQTGVEAVGDAERGALAPAAGALGGLLLKAAVFVGVLGAAYVGVSAYRANADSSDDKPARKPRKRAAEKAESDDEEAPAPREIAPPSPRKSPNELFDEAKAANR